MACTSCKTSHNVLSHGGWVNLQAGGGGSGAVVIWGQGRGVQCKIESLQILDLRRLASLHIMCCASVVSGLHLQAAFKTATLMGGMEEGGSLPVCCPRLIILSHWKKNLYQRSCQTYTVAVSALHIFLREICKLISTSTNMD